MGRVWQVIRGYIWWTYDRGSVPYDIMVTLILAFIFITPLFINFKDKPIERVPHPIGVVVYPDGASLVYEIDAAAVADKDAATVEQELLRVIEPIAGEVSIVRYQAQRDGRGRISSYKVWVTR